MPGIPTQQNQALARLYRRRTELWEQIPTYIQARRDDLVGGDVSLDRLLDLWADCANFLKPLERMANRLPAFGTYVDDQFGSATDQAANLPAEISHLNAIMDAIETLTPQFGPNNRIGVSTFQRVQGQIRTITTGAPGIDKAPLITALDAYLTWANS